MLLFIKSLYHMQKCTDKQFHIHFCFWKKMKPTNQSMSIATWYPPYNYDISASKQNYSRFCSSITDNRRNSSKSQPENSIILKLLLVSSVQPVWNSPNINGLPCRCAHTRTLFLTCLISGFEKWGVQLLIHKDEHLLLILRELMKRCFPL